MSDDHLSSKVPWEWIIVGAALAVAFGFSRTAGHKPDFHQGDRSDQGEHGRNVGDDTTPIGGAR